MWFRLMRRRRGRLILAGGLAAALGVAAAVVVAVRLGDTPPAPAGGSGGAATTAAPGTSGSPGRPAGPVGSATGSADPAVPPAAAAPVVSVLYSFDVTASRAMVDQAGQHSLRMVTAAGGRITFTPRGTGAAARFPARCRRAVASCPRAILESTQSGVFNPGLRKVRFGAAVLMTRADTAAGANVVQKGYSTDGGTQFKLQIDGSAGRPSCVVANSRTIYRLIAPVGVADGRWHSIACTRAGGAMSINVDGRAYSRQVPPTLSIVNNQPLRIGGKGVTANNDQYAGQIDEVFITIY